MNQNPYSEPSSDIQPAPSDGGTVVGASRARPIGHGWRWYARAWEMFTPAWGVWLGAAVLLLVIMFGLQVVPLVGPIAANLLAPVLMAGIIHMAHQSASGQGVEIGELFAGFRARTGSLIGLGALNLVVTIAIGAAMGVAIAVSATDMGDMQNMSSDEMTMQMFANLGAGSMIIVLLALALLIPWLAAYWFSVPLIVLGERSLGGALKESFFACFKNIPAFLWYGILYFILAVVASLPLLLGWLVLLPVLMLTYYVSFRDIFMED